MENNTFNIFQTQVRSIIQRPCAYPQHSSKHYKYIYFDQQDKSPCIFKCPLCIQEQNLNENYLVPLTAIIYSQDQQIFSNWRFLNDDDLQGQISDICSSNFNYLSVLSTKQTIVRFCSELKLQIINQIDVQQDLLINQADLVQTNSQRIFQQYQSFSQIKQIKSMLNDFNSSTNVISQNVRKIISEVIGRQKQNKVAIQKSLEDIKRQINEIQIEQPRIIKEMIFQNLSNVESILKDKITGSIQESKLQLNTKDEMKQKNVSFSTLGIQQSIENKNQTKELQTINNKGIKQIAQTFQVPTGKQANSLIQSQQSNQTLQQNNQSLTQADEINNQPEELTAFEKFEQDKSNLLDQDQINSVNNLNQMFIPFPSQNPPNQVVLSNQNNSSNQNLIDQLYPNIQYPKQTKQSIANPFQSLSSDQLFHGSIKKLLENSSSSSDLGSQQQQEETNIENEINQKDFDFKQTKEQQVQQNAGHFDSFYDGVINSSQNELLSQDQNSLSSSLDAKSNETNDIIQLIQTKYANELIPFYTTPISVRDILKLKYPNNPQTSAEVLGLFESCNVKLVTTVRGDGNCLFRSFTVGYLLIKIYSILVNKQNQNNNNNLKEQNLIKFIQALHDIPPVYLTESNQLFGDTYSISQISEVAITFCLYSLKQLLDAEDVIESLQTLFNIGLFDFGMQIISKSLILQATKEIQDKSIQPICNYIDYMKVLESIQPLNTESGSSEIFSTIATYLNVDIILVSCKNGSKKEVFKHVPAKGLEQSELMMKLEDQENNGNTIGLWLKEGHYYVLFTGEQAKEIFKVSVD